MDLGIDVGVRVCRDRHADTCNDELFDVLSRYAKSPSFDCRVDFGSDGSVKVESKASDGETRVLEEFVDHELTELGLVRVSGMMARTNICGTYD